MSVEIRMVKVRCKQCGVEHEMPEHGWAFRGTDNCRHTVLADYVQKSRFLFAYDHDWECIGRFTKEV